MALGIDPRTKMVWIKVVLEMSFLGAVLREEVSKTLGREGVREEIQYRLC